MLEVTAEFAQNITFNHERIERALPAGHLDATTLADYLVKKVFLIAYIFQLHLPSLCGIKLSQLPLQSEVWNKIFMPRKLMRQD